MNHQSAKTPSYTSPIRRRSLSGSKNKKINVRETKTNRSPRRISSFGLIESSSEEEKEKSITTPGSQNRFSCADINLSDSEEELIEELPAQDNKVLLNKPSVEEFLLSELNREQQIEIQERVRNKLKSLDTSHGKEMERLASKLNQIDKNAEQRKEADKRQDVEYRRTVAEIVDRHLSAIQYDHEQKSKIIERKLRDDAAALEEAKRLERAKMEEKVRQEKEKAQHEAEARQKAAQEAEKQQEAERRKVEEIEAAKKREEANVQALQNMPKIESQIPGVKVLGAQAALEAEAKRLKLRSEIPEMSLLPKELGKYDRRIAKCISKLLPTVENVRARAQEIIAAINDPSCPRPYTFCMLANKVVSLCRDRNTKDRTFEGTAFACGYVILLVTSQFPDAMDYILAEFNKACIFTVPKYLRPSDAGSRTREYFQMIGYREEEEGKMESTEAYLTYVSAYVKIFAAIIQSEIEGFNNPYGLQEGWKWIATFINHLPAVSSTAVALEAFLKMAGYGLHVKYKSQFMKILDLISRIFLPALKQKGAKVKAEAVTNLDYYLTGQLYLKEPEGRHLATSLLSRDLA
ncbi:hypothetical protein LUZ60_004348 [Juncus effusus]|nr:hypothetical protein LUZ60_004348 [Juncus effusus]